ncbi:MAG TPA: radical SAM protein, partial [Lachnospiraceae bacterium]|nr:radical SAM protein [Lachnospiraceae bacterium]
MIVYGPVPSRRLGQSLGVNNIPPKICSYSCVYCQIGRTKRMQIQREDFYKPEDIYSEVKSKVDQLKENGEHLDYISFVPDGEPTLDKNLGIELNLIKNLNVKIAVITNASLLWMDEVKEDLSKADWVSIKIDAVNEDIWHGIDRPHGNLSHQKVLEGMIDFSKSYKGTLVTETMLVSGLNDNTQHLESIAELISKINPQKSYILVPTRPPAENNICRASCESLIEAAGIINNISGVSVECITEDDTEQGFFFTDNIAEDLLNITSVHPIREDIINHYIKVKKADLSILKELINQNKITEYTYEGKR